MMLLDVAVLASSPTVTSYLFFLHLQNVLDWKKFGPGFNWWKKEATGEKCIWIRDVIAKMEEEEGRRNNHHNMMTNNNNNDDGGITPFANNRSSTTTLRQTTIVATTPGPRTAITTTATMTKLIPVTVSRCKQQRRLSNLAFLFPSHLNAAASSK
jgi:hypothetical protein